MPPDAARTARDLADVPVLVLDAPPAGAAELATALSAAGAFARLDERRLIAIARRSVLASVAEQAAAPARDVALELLRALDADRSRAAGLRLRRYRLDLSERARVMAILNVTPDSFYDRGRYSGVDHARRRAHELVALGADLIDIGGQSYAHWNPRVAEDEERARVVPVVEALVRDGIGVPLSIDTFKSGVAEGALAAGADLINDCSGLADERLAGVVASYDAALVVMHLKGKLNVRAPEYRYDDALSEIIAFLRERTEHATAAGVARDSIAVDPGLEFGKEPRTDLEILERFGDLRSLGYPILFAASRKSFIGRVFNRPAKELLVPSLATAALGILAGAVLVRVHDVAETVELATMLGAVTKPNRERIAIAAAMPSTPAAPSQA
ncbi:MAG: dihydropteroate synthase [Vulcanimicrobiaceae bacterium]